MKGLNIHLSGNTKVYGIIGSPVSHSFSPWMQSWFFKKNGINAVYCPFEVHPEHLPVAVAGLKSLNIQGMNVTVPHKEKVITCLDSMAKEVRGIGAVNTIVRKNGKFEGKNTDGYGFLKSLVTQGQVIPDRASFLIFGLGGAARAIIYTLAIEKAARVTVSSRDKDKSEEFCRQVNRSVSERVCESVQTNSAEFLSKLKDADVIVNCSPLGMKRGDPLPFVPEKCKKGALIFDLIYNPARTPLLLKAEKHGLKVLNGLGMLIFQGMKSFKLWTGIEVTSHFDTVYNELAKTFEVK